MIRETGLLYVESAIALKGYLNKIAAQQRWISHRVGTVQTFNSCTSRPVVYQCLVVEAPVDNMSTYNPSTSMAHVACESKSRSLVRLSVYSCPINRWQVGVWSCMVPRYLVQELNVGTVDAPISALPVTNPRAVPRRNIHPDFFGCLKPFLLVYMVRKGVSLNQFILNFILRSMLWV